MTDSLLAVTEQYKLKECETVIERGLNTFVDVGNALAAIRDGKLYRETHGTFEDYCRDKWGFSRPRAYQFIEAAETVGILSTIVDKPPAVSPTRAGGILRRSAAAGGISAIGI